tara:strand:+ start:8774 stop:9340 length:567 start_codon:yes stop_codon:yes gene_type:complete
MSDYSKCVIYKLVGNCGGVYIGHTIDIHNRKKGHECISNTCISRDLVKPIQLIELETYPCNNKQEACQREQYYMDLLSDNINKQRAYISTEDREKHQKIWSKRYYDNNRDECLIKSKQYQSQNREHVNEYNKTYHEEHKEEIHIRHRAYREEHRDELNEKKRIKRPCPICETLISSSGMARHIKRIHK